MIDLGPLVFEEEPLIATVRALGGRLAQVRVSVPHLAFAAGERVIFFAAVYLRFWLRSCSGSDDGLIGSLRLFLSMEQRCDAHHWDRSRLRKRQRPCRMD
jgi:hypothetical protein